MFKTHASMVVAGTDPRVLNAMSLGFQSNFTRYDAALDSRITFTRASSATYFDSAGVLQTAASGVARAHAFQDHDPSTLAPLGFLIEEQRTNSIRNNTMQGAVAGTPGTAPTNWQITTTNAELAPSIIGTGVESGISYIDVKIAGTVTSSRDLDIRLEAINQIAAAAGQAWTGAYYLRAVGGSQANIAYIALQANTYTSGSAYVNTPWADVPETVTTAALRTQRFSRGATLSDATVAFICPFLKVRTAATGTVDFTLRIGLPQLELGAFATSPILTTGSAATRLADSASITGAAFASIWNQSAVTIVAVADSRSGSSNAFICQADDGTSDNTLRMFHQTDEQSVFQVRTSGVSRFASGFGTITDGTPYKAAAAFSSGSNAAVLNGGTVTSNATAWTPSAAFTRLVIGNSQATEILNGHIQTLTIYRKRLSPNSVLQTLTTP